MAKFEVGDVVIGQGFNVTTKRNGMEAIIIEPEMMRHTKDDLGVRAYEPCYMVEWADGDVFAQCEYQLRKKKPPEESGDITETRQKGAPSFPQLMQDLKREEMVK